jgi:hypothetical protein
VQSAPFASFPLQIADTGPDCLWGAEAAQTGARGALGMDGMYAAVKP